MLALNNIEVVYDRVILVLKGISLDVPPRAITALLGANGAGIEVDHLGRDRVPAVPLARQLRAPLAHAATPHRIVRERPDRGGDRRSRLFDPEPALARVKLAPGTGARRPPPLRHRRPIR